MLHLLLPENAYKVYSKQSVTLKLEVAHHVYKTQLCRTTVKFSSTVKDSENENEQDIQEHIC